MSKWSCVPIYLVPNITDTDDGGVIPVRHGRKCVIPAPKKRMQSLRSASFPVHGARLFNCLPKIVHSWSNCSLDRFKGELDKYLMVIPDEPQITGYTANHRVESNSILHMTSLITGKYREEVTPRRGNPLSRWH